MFKKKKVKQHIRRTKKGISLVKSFDRDQKVKPFVIGALAGAGSIAALGTAFVIGRKNGLNALKRIPRNIKVRTKQPNIVVNVAPPNVNVNPKIKVKLGKTVNDINVDIKQPNINVNNQTVNKLDLETNVSNRNVISSKNTNVNNNSASASAESVADASADAKAASNAVNINVQKPEPRVIGSTNPTASPSPNTNRQPRPTRASKSKKPDVKVSRKQKVKPKVEEVPESTAITKKPDIETKEELKKQLTEIKEDNIPESSSLATINKEITEASTLKVSPSKTHKAQEKVSSINKTLKSYKEKQSKILKENDFDTKKTFDSKYKEVSTLRNKIKKEAKIANDEVDGIASLKDKHPKIKEALDNDEPINPRDVMDDDDLIEDVFRYRLKTGKVDLSYLNKEVADQIVNGARLSDIDRELGRVLSFAQKRVDEISISKNLAKADKENVIAEMNDILRTVKRQRTMLEQDSLNFEAVKNIERNESDLIKSGFKKFSDLEDEYQHLSKIKDNLDVIDNESENVLAEIVKSNLKKNQSVVSKLKGDYITDGIFVYKRKGRGVSTQLEYVPPKGKSGQDLDYRKLDSTKITENDYKRALEDADPEEAKQILKVIRTTRSSLAKTNAANVKLNTKRIKDAVLKGDIIKEEGRYIALTPKGKSLLERKGALSKQLNNDILNLQKTGRYTSDIKVLSDFEINSVNIELLSDKNEEKEVVFLMSDVITKDKTNKYKTHYYDLKSIL